MIVVWYYIIGINNPSRGSSIETFNYHNKGRSGGFEAIKLDNFDRRIALDRHDLYIDFNVIDIFYILEDLKIYDQLLSLTGPSLVLT